MWTYFFGIFFLPLVLTQNCNYVQRVGVNPTPIQLPHAPYQYYKGGDVCTWTFGADNGYNIILDCFVAAAGGLKGICPLDYFIVSRNGNKVFAGGTKYCGHDRFVEKSVTNILTMGLFSELNSTGGNIDCLTYAVHNPCNCGRRNINARIVGGVDAGVNEFPMVAGLVRTGENDPYCGAVIISEYRALTVRHCVSNKTVDSFQLLVGEHDIRTTSESVFTKRYTIASYTCVNGCVADRLFSDDIAMVKTTWNILLNRGVGITCLPWKHYSENLDEYAGQKVEVAGWGDVDFGEGTQVLQKVTLDVIPWAQCAEVYFNYTTSNNLCTLTPDKDACSGDSGGSLFWTAPDTGLLHSVALVSSGFGCARNRYPGIQTRIAPNLKWILRNSPESSYCIV